MMDKVPHALCSLVKAGHDVLNFPTHPDPMEATCLPFGGAIWLSLSSPEGIFIPQVLVDNEKFTVLKEEGFVSHNSEICRLCLSH